MSKSCCRMCAKKEACRIINFMTENCNIYNEECGSCPPCASFIEIDADTSTEKLMKRLKTTRIGREMSEDYIAHQLGIKKSRFKAYENKTRKMPLDLFIKYCHLIGLDIYSMWRQ